MREQKGADSFGFWVTHGGRESLARISSCCLAFIFRLLCPISNCFGGYDFISFIVLVILFILFSVAVAVSPLGFSLCKFDILVTANCCTIILASLCHGNPLCASAEKTSLIRPSTIDHRPNRIESYLYAPQNVRVRFSPSLPSLSLSCANIVALSIIYDLYFAASAPHGPVAKF